MPPIEARDRRRAVCSMGGERHAPNKPAWLWSNRRTAG